MEGRTELVRLAPVLAGRAAFPGLEARATRRLFVASLDASGIQRVSEDGSGAVYAAGQLLFLRGLSVFARPFDAARLVFTGPERLIAAQAGFFSVSDTRHGCLQTGAPHASPR